jgi:hypothetical protein
MVDLSTIVDGLKMPNPWDALQNHLDQRFDNLGAQLDREMQRDYTHQDQYANQLAIRDFRTAENLLHSYQLTHQYDSLNSADQDSSHATEFLIQQRDPFFIAGLIDAAHTRIDVFRAFDDYLRTHDPSYHGWAHDSARRDEINVWIGALQGMIDAGNDSVRQNVESLHTIGEHQWLDQDCGQGGCLRHYVDHLHHGRIVNSFEWTPSINGSYARASADAQADRSWGIANELAYLSIPQFEATLDTWRNLASALWVTASTATPTAGSPFNLTVAARDPHGNLLTGYTGTVHVSSSDGQAVLPIDYHFTSGDAGVHTFTVTLRTAGAQTVTATDTTSTPLNGDFDAFTVTPAAASRLVVGGFPSSITAGNSGSFTVTAYDPYNNVATGYTDMVHFTSTDTQASLPTDARLTNGTGGPFSAILKTAGNQSIIATDTVNASVRGTQSGIVVNPAEASTLLVSGFPSSITAGNSGSFTVTAYDPYNNVATGYRGNVHFTSSDPQADLPGDYTFTSGDGGWKMFSATLKTAESQWITATDTQFSGITDSQTGILVTPAAPSRFDVSAPDGSVANVSFSITVTAYDTYNNLATNYTGTVHFDSSDPQAVLPTDSGLTNGVGTFSMTLLTAGNQSLIVTDAAHSAEGSATVTITPATASRLSLSTPASAVAGEPFTVTVTAYDPYGNVATAYGGLVHFLSSDPQADLPTDYHFTSGDNGVHSFSVILNTTGDQTVIVFDVMNINLLTGATVTVSSGGDRPGPRGGPMALFASVMSSPVRPGDSLSPAMTQGGLIRDLTGRQPPHRSANVDRVFAADLEAKQPIYPLTWQGQATPFVSLQDGFVLNSDFEGDTGGLDLARQAEVKLLV